MDTVALTDDWSLWRDFAIRSSGFPVEGLDGVRPRRGRAAGRGGARPGLPRGGGVAEPRVARARRRQARRGRRRQPVAPAPLDRRGRQLLAALLLQERHDRVLRAARVGLVRERRGDLRALRRPPSASASCTSRRGRWRPSPPPRASRAAADGPVPRARAAAAARRHVRARPPGGRAGGGRRRRGARTSPPRSTSSTASSRPSPAGRPRAPRATAAAAARSPTSTACATSTDARPGGARRAARLAARVLYASRWWCGRVFDRGAELLGAIAARRSGPLAPHARPADGRGLRARGTRWATSSASCSGAGRRSSPASHAADAFGDWTPAWHGSAYHSADLQIAAATSTRWRAATSSSCSATSTAATTRSPRASSGSGTPTRPRCCGGSPRRPGPGVHLSPRAAAWSR